MNFNNCKFRCTHNDKYVAGLSVEIKLGFNFIMYLMH